MNDQLKQGALDFYEFPVPGKIQASPTKPLAAQRGLTLAHSPGVIAPCLEIEKGPLKTYKYTARGNLMAVIFNGAAVLGSDDTGVLAGGPVVKGRSVLFKKFAGINVFGIEIDELDPDKSIEVVAVLELTFGGINLENIKASKCSYIRQKLRGRMDVPVFRDNQYGTVIINTTAIPNGLRVVEKNISDVRMMISDAGTVTIACINLLVALGLQEHNIVVCDSKGVIYQGCEPNMAKIKAAHAVVNGGRRTLDDVVKGADIFLGRSGPRVLTQEMVKKITRAPMTLALTDPKPEILLPLMKEVRPDAIICTGRSDYPDQADNVLYFPPISHGALDVGATVINEETKLAMVRVTAGLVRTEQGKMVASAYDDQGLSFGPEYIILKPLDPCLIVKIAPAVAKATMESGVATYPIADFNVYTDRLVEFVCKTNLFMRPILFQAHRVPKHVVLSGREGTRTLHATQELVMLGLAKPILIGRPSATETRTRKLSLQIKAGVDFEIVNSESDPRFKGYWTEYFQITKRRGVTQEQAQRALVNNPTVIGTVMVQRGEADVTICGTMSDYYEHFSVVKNAFGCRNDVRTAGAMNTPLLPSDSTFIVDTYVNDGPDAEKLVEIALMAAETVCHFGIEPYVALLLYSNFSPSDYSSSSKMHQAPKLVRDRVPDLMIGGEVHGGVVLMEAIRNDRMSGSPLEGSTNILVIPNMGAARVSYNLLRVSNSGGVAVGPVLVGTAKPIHVLTPIASVRRVVNMVALAVAEA